MSDFRPVKGEFTGRHMLLVMVAFFGIVIAVNLVMAALATRSWTGLVVENSYVASQQFNGELAAARRQAELGWQAELSVAADSARAVFATGGTPPAGDLAVTLALSRPTHEAEDRTVPLTATGAGEFQADLDLKPGVWNAELTAVSTGGQSFRQLHRIIIEAGAGP